MRTDLDFLYQKAMRSADPKFLCEVFDEIVGYLDEDKVEKLNNRILHLAFNSWDMGDIHSDKFSFLIGDSQMGADWYRNR